MSNLAIPEPSQAELEALGKRSLEDHVLKGRVLVDFPLPEDNPIGIIADVMPNEPGFPGIYASTNPSDVLEEISRVYEGETEQEKIAVLKEDLRQMETASQISMPVFYVPTIVSENDTVQMDCNFIHAGKISDSQAATNEAMEIITEYMNIYLAQLMVKLGAQPAASKVPDSFREYNGSKFRSRMNPLITAIFYAIDKKDKPAETQAVSDAWKFLQGSFFLPDLSELVTAARKNHPERAKLTGLYLEKMSAFRDMNLPFARGSHQMDLAEEAQSSIRAINFEYRHKGF